MPKKIYILLLFILFLIAEVTGFSAINKENLPKSEGIFLSVDNTKPLIGDKININLIISIPKESNLNYINLEDSLKSKLDKIEILKTISVDTIKDVGTKFKYISAVYQVSSYFAGKFTINSFTNYYFNNSQNITQNITQNIIDSHLIVSNSLNIVFGGMNADTSKAFKDIKDNIDVDFDYIEYVYWFIGIILLLILGYWGLNFIKNRKTESKVIESVTPTIPPHLLALEELKSLENEKLWQNEKVKQYHIRITDIIRKYIENAFGIYALEMTSDEIITEVRKVGISSDLINQLNDVLIVADLVKFAKYETIPEDNINSMKKTLDFVKLSHHATLQKNSQA